MRMLFFYHKSVPMMILDYVHAYDNDDIDGDEDAMIKSGIAPPSGIRLRIDNWHVTYDWIFYYDNVVIMLNSLHKSCGKLVSATTCSKINKIQAEITAISLKKTEMLNPDLRKSHLP